MLASLLHRLQRVIHPLSHRWLNEADCAREPIILEGLRDHQPYRAITDCVKLLPMPRLTPVGMKQGMVLAMMRARFGQHDLKFVGNGEFAVVYDVSACEPALLEQLLHCLTSPLVTSWCPTGPVVLKFTIVPDTTAYQNVTRENLIHRFLSSASITVKGHQLEMGARVPAFFYAGYLDGWYVTAMEAIEGISLQDKTAVDALTQQEYQNVQKLLYDMWCLGVVHADVHTRNIMCVSCDNDRYSFVLIDFGNALFLPAVFVRRLRDSFNPDADAVQIWSDVLSLYVRTIIGSRYLRGFQPDGLLLKTLRPPKSQLSNLKASF